MHYYFEVQYNSINLSQCILPDSPAKCIFLLTIEKNIRILVETDWYRVGGIWAWIRKNKIIKDIMGERCLCCAA